VKYTFINGSVTSEEMAEVHFCSWQCVQWAMGEVHFY
jgi:hypothetical protein